MDLTIQWSKEKNSLLKKERNISFEDVEYAILNDDVIDIVPHHNKDKYPGQELFILQIDHCIYYVPFVIDKEKVFLKTIIPSRKYNKKFKKKR